MLGRHNALDEILTGWMRLPTGVVDWGRKWK